ncbi:alpha/beta hydrolase family protein [Sphingobacterium corticibacterium]|uniref:Alpha/beta hydrolase n=1 Tax=Sphingobacterium corticibacterium TaxID=2484746 RepID=A0A4Q6XF93_9SPHI|nr:alpha/beta hydrolase [Sphingobacterium corticibacterium]RZF58530.1 alpha/beta hydrolase [Sphingobacterium corticibacterium]
MKYYIVFLIVLLQSCFGYSQKFVGTWQGELNVQGVALPLIFHLEHASVWKGAMESPAQGNAKLPVSAIHIEQDSISIAVASIGLTYNGKLLSDGVIEGVVSQNSMTFLMRLLKAENTLAKRRRPQLPEPPYSYDTVDVTFSSEYDDVKLAGTITTPRKGEKLPAVVLVSGSGPQDRDETIIGHKPFKVIADYLTKQGVVVLRYDERGIGASTGNYPKSTIGDFSRDVIAAVGFIQKQERVDPARVGIIGHSEGALIAELIAGESSADVGFIGLLGAPAIPIDSLMVLQAFEIGKLMGMSTEALQEAKEVNRRNFATVKSDLGDEDAYRQILENMSLPLPNLSDSQKDEIKMMVLPAYRYFMRIDPIPFIKKIDVPVFAAYGTKDVQVPFAPNLESLTDHLPPNERNFLKAYDGLNHLFQTAETGAVSEYIEIEETFNEKVLSDLAKWINDL